MSKKKLTIDDVFASDGVLSQAFPGYQVRDAQLQMASAVEESIQKKQKLVVEAGTGTGKTFAYLIPALLSGKKVIISTGTKTLQDQLFFRDLPVVMKLLNSTVKKALLKGRANYLCLHRMMQSYEEGRFSSKKVTSQLVAVKHWSQSTDHGDLAECPSLDERSPIIPYVTSTSDNCLNSDCDFYDKCFLFKARRRAQKADIVVVNHHLYFADQAVKERVDKTLIPDADVVIFDEAHQLSEIATQFLGDVFSSRQLNLFVNDFKLVAGKDAPDVSGLDELLNTLSTFSSQALVAFGQVNRNTYSNIKHKPALKTAMNALSDKLKAICTIAEKLAMRSKDLESCWQRAISLKDNFEKLHAEPAGDQIHWYELGTKSFRLHLTPLSIKQKMQDIMSADSRAWVFTSATLATGKNNFALFVSELGMKNFHSHQLQSPFDFEKQALLYLPQGMKEPRNPDYMTSIINAALPVLKLTRGRAFLLFTSYRAMQEAYALLSRHSDFTLIMQGQASKAALLKQFTALDNCVLLGTSSFWEGVDVRGEDLSLVLIDKLPFSVPDEPIIKARMDAMRKKGEDPFTNYSLPQAVLSLKQGAGRLIRDVSDQGVLMLCDPRLTSQHYGKVFLESLPPMSRTDKFDDVKTFLEDIFETV